MIGDLDRVGVAKSHEKLHTSHSLPRTVCNEPVQFFAKRYLHKFMHKYPASRDRSMNICLELVEVWSIHQDSALVSQYHIVKTFDPVSSK